MNAKSIRSLQELIYSRVLSDPYLKDVPVLFERKGLLDSQIEEALSTFNERAPGKGGLVILVMLPDINLSSSDAPGPQLNLLPPIRVIERPEFNSIGLEASEVAVRLLCLFHLWSTGSEMQVIKAEKEAARPVTLTAGTVAFDVFLSTEGGFDGRSVPPVFVSAQGGLVALRSHDALASIWYTLDGSYPLPEAPSLQYTAPFPLPTGQLLKACAYNGDQIPSNLNQQQF